MKFRYNFFVFIFLVSCQVSTKKENKKQPVVVTPATLKKSIVIEKPDIITLGFVGDVILHERLRKREDKTKEGYQVIWSEIQNYIEKPDITYANLEGPVAPDLGGVSGFPMFNYPEKIISDLKNNGFDLVSTANNHALDRRANGIRKTIENLKKYKLAHTGTISSESALELKQESWWHLTQTRKTTIAWLSCTEMTNGIRDKENQVLYCFKDIEKVKKLILALKESKKVSAIILLPHWGEEEKFEIESYRRRWAHIMLDLGASAVVGSHPHVVQKIESYTTKDQRQTLIAYSMGNFLTNQQADRTKTSMMLFLKFKKNPEQLALTLEDIKYLPLWMSRKIDRDGTSKFRLMPAFDFKKFPKEAVKIWTEQLGNERRLKEPSEVESFLK